MEKIRTIMPNGRYTDDELELLKNVFAENMELIKVIRKVMLQLDMSEAEEVMWKKTFSDNEALSALMRKMFLPTIDGDAPIHQLVDLYMTINMENKLPEEIASLVKSRQMIVSYLDNQLKVLSGEIKENKTKLAQFDLTDVDALRARNTIIMHTENQLHEINGLAGYKVETTEETVKRLSQNSSK